MNMTFTSEMWLAWPRLLGYIGDVMPANSGTHILRHTAASRLLRAGADLKQIADILGHRSIDTTAVYTKVDIDRLAAVAVQWPALDKEVQA